MDLALNNLQRLIYHKTQQTKPIIHFNITFLSQPLRRLHFYNIKLHFVTEIRYGKMLHGLPTTAINLLIKIDVGLYPHQNRVRWCDTPLLQFQIEFCYCNSSRYFDNKFTPIASYICNILTRCIKSIEYTGVFKHTYIAMGGGNGSKIEKRPYLISVSNIAMWLYNSLVGSDTTSLQFKDEGRKKDWEWVFGTVTFIRTKKPVRKSEKRWNRGCITKQFGLLTTSRDMWLLTRHRTVLTLYAPVK